MSDQTGTLSIRVTYNYSLVDIMMLYSIAS
jgi:hypothetical protein